MTRYDDMIDRIRDVAANEMKCSEYYICVDVQRNSRTYKWEVIASAKKREDAIHIASCLHKYDKISTLVRNPVDGHVVHVFYQNGE